MQYKFVNKKKSGLKQESFHYYTEYSFDLVVVMVVVKMMMMMMTQFCNSVITGLSMATSHIPAWLVHSLLLF